MAAMTIRPRILPGSSAAAKALAVGRGTDAERAVERDKFMTAEEAKAFGLIDQVVTTRDPPEKESRPHLAA